MFAKISKNASNKFSSVLNFFSVKRRSEASSFVPHRLEYPNINDFSDVDGVVDAIEEYCRQTDDSFIDDSFPHADRSIGDTSHLEEQDVEIVWLRPKDIKTKNDEASSWTVFNNPRPTDIKQGYLGNCWLQSALAVMAERPELLKEIILTPEYNSAGIYKIRLCVDGLWQTVFVDDYFPCYKNDHRMLFAVGQNNQLWVSLIEKAMAKIHGSYTALMVGNPIEAFTALTGVSCARIWTEISEIVPPEKAFDELELIWARLLSARDANFLMSASCGSVEWENDEEEYKILGLLPNHAYSILDIRQYNGFRLMRLRNPWGKFVWLGEWSHTWSEWTPEAKAALEFEKTQNDIGTFWMPFEFFTQYFNSVQIAAIRPHWSDQRFKFDLDWEQPSMMKVTVHESTEMSFSLFRRHARQSVDKPDLLLLVHKEDPAIDGRPGELVVSSGRHYLNSVSIKEKFVEPGTYVVCAMSFLNFYEVKNLLATMVIHSASPAVEATIESAHPNALRESLVQMVLENADAIDTKSNIRFYIIQNYFNGFLLMADNLNDSQCIQIQTDCSESHNVVSSRGAPVVSDCIPPLHRQIIIVLTRCESEENYKIDYSIKQRLSEQYILDDFAFDDPACQHEPDFDEMQSVLHSPQPLYL